nr:hypothetical protein [Polymorphobacter sp.]
MTEPTGYFHDRAAEIIAAYGGDTARWPDAERATALAVIAGNPALKAALTEARKLDVDLTSWACRPVRNGDARMAAAAAMRQPRSFMRWAAGGSIAASLAAAIVLLTPTEITPSTAAPRVTVATLSDEAAFEQVFTLTPDEEHLL